MYDTFQFILKVYATNYEPVFSAILQDSEVLINDTLSYFIPSYSDQNSGDEVSLTVSMSGE